MKPDTILGGKITTLKEVFHGKTTSYVCNSFITVRENGVEPVGGSGAQETREVRVGAAPTLLVVRQILY